MKSSKVSFHAVARIDTYIRESASWSDKVTVVQLFAEQQDAVDEVDRLNALNGGKGSVYFVTIARVRLSEITKLWNSTRQPQDVPCRVF